MSSTTTEASTPQPSPAAGGKGAGARNKRRGPFGRIALLYREVVAELRKVIWPTRQELIGYTIVVLVFVTFMVSLVAAFDFGFVKFVGALFG